MSAQERREITDAEIAAREYDEGAWFDAERYRRFIERKSQLGGEHGFAPLWMPEFLYDFQRALIEWALLKGRAAIFADCGLGKTPMQLVWAENVRRKANGNVLILTPLAVAQQTCREAAKFGIEAAQSRDGKIAGPITVTNYEQLHHFDREQFVGVVCDESSILKNHDGKTKALVTEFLRRMKYRLLCTATAAPNDFIELGTSSEALGELGFMDMLNRFFVNEQNNSNLGSVGFGNRAKWRFKGHAEEPFWKWVASWARAMRRPSDMGFPDNGFLLPPLEEREHVVKLTEPRSGEMFYLEPSNKQEFNEDRRNSIKARCETLAALVNGHNPALVWCNLNDEGDLLEKIIPDAVQVAGCDSDEKKEETLLGFADGSIRVLVTKPKIGAWGLNFQRCHHVLFFPTFSHEQHYQGTRRCWRYPQRETVVVDNVISEGERGVIAALKRKAAQADRMFDRLVLHMNNAIGIHAENKHTTETEIPKWL